MKKAVDRLWHGKGALPALGRATLLPASFLFGLAAAVRRGFWKLPRLRKTPAEAFVVSVGNLTVGGTGKTPTALWLATALSDRGHSVAIVTRGYGGRSRGPVVVGDAKGDLPSSGDWRAVGDEAVLLARRFPGPTIVAKRRRAGVKAAVDSFGADVVVLDDAFQHAAAPRDFDVVCVRAGSLARPRLLPRGPFREPLRSLRRADAVIVTKRSSATPEGGDRERIPEGVPVWDGTLAPDALVTSIDEVWRETPMGRLMESRALALSGVADPTSFYEMIHEWGGRPQDFLEFPDHHAYSLPDWKQVAHRARGLDLVVTTEKDLVKLAEYPFAKGKLVAMRVSMIVEDGDRMLDAIEKRIEEKRKERWRR